jgi:hypothetical protein
LKTANKKIVKRSREPSQILFRDGSTVPRSGVYGVLHTHHHHLTLQAHLIQDHAFPSCPRCDGPVMFKLITPIVAESALLRFRLLSGS